MLAKKTGGVEVLHQGVVTEIKTTLIKREEILRAEEVVSLKVLSTKEELAMTLVNEEVTRRGEVVVVSGGHLEEEASNMKDLSIRVRLLTLVFLLPLPLHLRLRKNQLSRCLLVWRTRG